VSNEVLNVIVQRRSIYQFTSEPVPEEKITSILEAGRWAPSYANTQPWEFIVVTNSELKREVSEIAKETMAAHAGIEGAHAIIVTCVDPEKDPYHYIEDGAVATQNIALAAHSLGLASYWVGIFSLEDVKNSVMNKIKQILNIPRQIRVMSLLPVGACIHYGEAEKAVGRNSPRRQIRNQTNRYGGRRSKRDNSDDDEIWNENTIAPSQTNLTNQGRITCLRLLDPCSRWPNLNRNLSPARPQTR